MSVYVRGYALLAGTWCALSGSHKSSQCRWEGMLYWLVPGAQCQVLAGHVSVGKRVRFTGWYLVHTVR